MKIFILLFLAFLVGACTPIKPSVESGYSTLDVRYFHGTNSSLKVIVSTIKEKDSGKIWYAKASRKPFSGNSVNLPAGIYVVTYQCMIDDTQVSANSFRGLATPEFADVYNVVEGERLKLFYLIESNIQHGNHCKPVYRSG